MDSLYKSLCLLKYIGIFVIILTFTNKSFTKNVFSKNFSINPEYNLSPDRISLNEVVHLTVTISGTGLSECQLHFNKLKNSEEIDIQNIKYNFLYKYHHEKLEKFKILYIIKPKLSGNIVIKSLSFKILNSKQQSLIVNIPQFHIHVSDNLDIQELVIITSIVITLVCLALLINIFSTRLKIIILFKHVKLKYSFLSKWSSVKKQALDNKIKVKKLYFLANNYLLRKFNKKSISQITNDSNLNEVVKQLISDFLTQSYQLQYKNYDIDDNQVEELEKYFFKIINHSKKC